MKTTCLFLLSLVCIAVIAGCGGGGDGSGGNQVIARLSAEVKANRDNAQSYANRGLAYLEIAQYEKAREDFKKATELEGNNALWHVLYARALLGKKQYEAALARTVRAKVFNPRLDLQDIYWVRGQILKAQGMDEAAAAAFDTAVRVDTGKVEPRLKRAEFYVQSQRFPDAIKDCGRAIARDSNSAAAWGMRGRAYLFANKLDSATIDLERARKLEPSNPHFLSDLGRAYYERRNKTSARGMYGEALKFKDRLPAAEVKGIQEALEKLESQ
jgi:tetratricopeptide (TPR) repeat protein